MTERPDVILTTDFWHPEAVRRLGEAYTVHDATTSDKLAAVLAEAADRIRAVATDGINGIPNSVLEKLPNVEIVGNNGVGYDKVDVAWCNERGIKVCNTPGVLNEAVAELTLALMLAHARRIPEYDAYVREGRWEREGAAPVTLQLAGARAGIIGLGRIGRAIAKRCEAMGMSVAYHNRRPVEDATYAYHPDARSLAENVDWLIAILPATPETLGIVSREVLEALGPDGVFVNVGRGPLHDEAALIDLLQNGKLGGAALDVFAQEPHVPEALRRAPNVTLSPHQGSATHVTRIGMGQLVIDNFDAHFAGQPLLTEVTS